MTELITYETISGSKRVEERATELQKLPEGFFESVRVWIEHKEGQRTPQALLEGENAKKLIDYLINIRLKKIVLGALHTVRGDVPPSNLTEDEQKFFDQIVFILNGYRNNLREKFISYDSIVQEKVDAARVAVTDSGIDKLVESTGLAKKEETSIVQSVEENVLHVMETPKEDSVEAAGKTVVQEAPAQPVVKPEKAPNSRVLSDMPAFIGPDLQTRGPFVKGTEVYLPGSVREMLVKRGVIEGI